MAECAEGNGASVYAFMRHVFRDWREVRTQAKENEYRDKRMCTYEDREGEGMRREQPRTERARSVCICIGLLS